MNRPMPKLSAMLDPLAKAAIGDVATHAPEMMESVYHMAAQARDVPSLMYIAEHHADKMPAKVHGYLRKLVLTARIMESEKRPDNTVVAGMLLGLGIESRKMQPDFARAPDEVVKLVCCLEMGVPFDLEIVDIDKWASDNNFQQPVGGQVEVGAEGKAAAAAGGLNIDALTVPGNGTKH